LQDIDFRNKQIRIKTEKQGPFEILDSMAIHDKLELLLNEYIGEYEREIVAHNGFLFFAETSRGKQQHISSDRARNIFRKVCERAGLNEFYGYREPISNLKNWKPGKLHKHTTHSLRYAFAQFLRRKKIPIEIRQHLMRHKDISTTQIYDAPQKEEIDEELRKAFAIGK